MLHYIENDKECVCDQAIIESLFKKKTIEMFDQEKCIYGCKVKPLVTSQYVSSRAGQAADGAGTGNWRSP